MTGLLFTVLIVFDIALLAAVFFMNKKQEAHIDLIEDLTEERRLLLELRQSIQEELEAAHHQTSGLVDRMTQLATEAEHEVRSGTETISDEITTIAAELNRKFEQPLEQLTHKQAYMENLLKRIEREKSSLHKLIRRGEKLVHLVKADATYEDIVSELEEKKYDDARQMLARGESHDAIARELGLSPSEIRLVAGLGV